jgi:hypothetical protein
MDRVERILKFLSEQIDRVTELAEQVYEFAINYPVAFAIVLILLLGAHLRDNSPFDNLRKDLAKPPADALKKLFVDIAKMLDVTSNSSIISSDKIFSTLTAFFIARRSQAANVGSLLHGHIFLTINVIAGPKRKYRIWRLLGSVITGLALCSFIYADINQIVFNLAPKDPALADWADSMGLGNRGISTLIASIGASFTLALIFIDCVGITHFIPWEGVKPKRGGTKRKTSIRTWAQIISFVFFLFNLVIALLVATTQLQNTILKSQIYLPEQMLKTLYFWLEIASLTAHFAQILVLIPMLVTTFLLFWGITSLVLIYALLVTMLWLIVSLAILLFETICNLLELIQPTSKLFTSIVLMIFSWVFTLIGLLLGLSLDLAEKATKVVQLAFNIIFGFIGSILKPFIAIGGFLRRMFS